MVDQRRKSTRDVPRPTANVQGAPWTIRSQLAEKLNGRLGVRWSRRIRGDNVGILEPLCVVATVELGLGLHAEFLFFVWYADPPALDRPRVSSVIDVVLVVNWLNARVPVPISWRTHETVS